MRYCFLWILLILLVTSCVSQKKSYEDLLKYSYKIQGINDSTKQYVQAGTGFIINAGGHDFLITNYHVLTGKDPISGKKISSISDTCTSIVIWVRKYNDTSFIKWKIPLYDSIGKLFSLYHADQYRLVDIGVLTLSSKQPPLSIISKMPRS